MSLASKIKEAERRWRNSKFSVHEAERRMREAQIKLDNEKREHNSYLWIADQCERELLALINERSVEEAEGNRDEP